MKHSFFLNFLQKGSNILSVILFALVFFQQIESQLLNRQIQDKEVSIISVDDSGII